MLKDQEADAALGRDGYVVIDLLDSAQVDRLITAWTAIEAEWEPQWDPTGLAVTIRHPSIDERADEALRPTIAATLAPLVEETGPFISAFLAKRPFSDELPAHLDWRLVDEAEEFTYGCWVPLEAVTAQNGGLGVYPGSHLSVDFDRTPSAPGHEWVSTFVADRSDAVILEIAAGQAVIYDHRLVHFSPPNQTSRTRLAINSGLAPLHRIEQARSRVLAMMAQGMGGQGTDPQIPEDTA